MPQSVWPSQFEAYKIGYFSDTKISDTNSTIMVDGERNRLLTSNLHISHRYKYSSLFADELKKIILKKLRPRRIYKSFN